MLKIKSEMSMDKLEINNSEINNSEINSIEKSTNKMAKHICKHLIIFILLIVAVKIISYLLDLILDAIFTELNQMQIGELGKDIIIMAVFLIYATILFLVPYIFQKKIYHDGIRNLGFRKPFVRNIVIGYIIGFILTGFQIGITLLFSENVSIQSNIPNDISLFLFIFKYILYFSIVMVTINSFLEELIYRAFPYEILTKEQVPQYIIIIFSSLCFTLNHFIMLEPFSILRFLILMSAGFVFMIIYIQSKSIWAAIGAHNSTNITIILFYGGSWENGGLLNVSYNPPIEGFGNYITLIVNLVIIGVFIFLYIKKSQSKE